MKHLFTSFFLLLLTSSTVFASSGDADAGKTKAATCGGCHGANGIGANGTYPNLAGQHADYIVKQLKAFKTGDRKNPLMSPMASPLSEQDMADVAAFYQSLPRDGGSSSKASGSTNKAAAKAVKYQPDAAAGKSLYELGDTSRSIGACIGCHGKDGHSKVLIYPNLAKQHPEYIAKQLHNFKSKARTNNYAMSQFASNMTDNDIADIAAYLADTTAVANIAPRKIMPSAAMSEQALAGKAKAAACAACHGADGNSPIAINPKLAGQSASYLVKQLQDFKSGTRKNAIMAPMAAALSTQDMQEIASFYAAQKITVSQTETSEIGRKLYFGGGVKIKAKITACAACHGAKGQGMANAKFPAIAGQNASYIKAQLLAFKNGSRANDYNSMMQNVANKLSTSDIDELAKFVSALK